MTKKLVSLILLFSFILNSVAVFNVYAKDVFIENLYLEKKASLKVYSDEKYGVDYYYSEENDEITIHRAAAHDAGNLTEIEIIGEIDGKPVTRFANNAFFVDWYKIQEITIPDSVREIGSENFVELKKLQRVNFGNGLEKIGADCFSYCRMLRYFTLPDSLRQIDKYSFLECAVESVVIPEGVTTLETLFGDCRNLTEIVIPDTVTTIRESFLGCDALKSVTIPSSVKTLGYYSFNGCSELEEIIWDSDSVEDIEKHVFLGTKYLKNYPEEYIAVNHGKVFGMYLGEDEEFSVPDGVEKIVSCAFSQGAYGNEKSTLKRIILPDSVKELSPASFSRTLLLENVEFGKNVTVIPANAFAGSGIKEMTIPDGVTRLKEGVFGDCKNLKKITLPDTLESIGTECFSGCESLTDIVLPESLTSIGTKVFKNCTSLKKLNIPSGIASNVNKNTFYAFSVEKADYSGKLTNDIYESLPKKAWQNVIDSGDDFVVIDGVLKSYGGNDKHIKIPEGVKEISKRAFFEKDFETVTFPSTLEKIGELAFYASPIKEVTIPSNVRIVGEMSFAQCPDLKKVVIENGVKQVDGLAFAYCNLLDDVTIGEGVRAAKNAFDDTPYKYSVSADEYNSPTWEAPTGIVPMPTPKPSASPTPTATPSIEPSSAPTLTVTSSNGGLNVTVNEKPVVFTDAKPFIDEHDRTQIPVRAVSEMLGCDVEWDGANRTVTVNHGDDVIRLVIGSDVMYVNGSAVKMDTQAVIKDDRTYVPIRYIGEMTGCEVVYSEK